MDKLKPCPFCGGKARVRMYSNSWVDWWLASCPQCHISQTGNGYEYEVEAIKAWNRRADKEREADRVVG